MFKYVCVNNAILVDKLEMCLLDIVILKKKLHAVLGNEEMLKEFNLPS